MPKQKNLRELFHDTLKDIYFAEKKILAALPKMVKAAQSEELKAAFQKHEGETEGHVERLDKVFAELDEPPRSKTCDAIVGIIQEGQEEGKPGLGRGFACGRPSGRALRNLALRDAEDLGARTGIG